MNIDSMRLQREPDQVIAPDKGANPGSATNTRPLVVRLGSSSCSFSP